MPVDLVTLLPTWLLAGIALGGAATGVIAGIFYLGDRYLASAGRVHRHGTERRRSGSAKRRNEIRVYLDAIGEHYEESHPIAGTTVDFYLPQRDVAVTFDGQSFFRVTETDTTAILWPEELPARLLGRRLPFDVPPIDETVRVRQGPRNDAVRDAFDELGIPPSSPEAAIQDAYRDRVTAVHPDQGGSAEAFRSVQAAYAVALDHADERSSSGDASDTPF